MKTAKHTLIWKQILCMALALTMLILTACVARGPVSEGSGTDGASADVDLNEDIPVSEAPEVPELAESTRSDLSYNGSCGKRLHWSFRRA